MVLYGFLVITQTLIRTAKITINITLPMLASCFFSYIKMQVVKFSGFFEITRTVISIAKIAKSTTLYDFLDIT